MNYSRQLTRMNTLREQIRDLVWVQDYPDTVEKERLVAELMLVAVQLEQSDNTEALI